MPPSSPSPPASAVPPPDPALIERLRARIRAMEGFAGDGTRGPAVPLGLAAIDRVLPWRGLPPGAVHEIAAGDESAAATGFAAFLLARFAADGRTVLWCRRGRDLYGPGLAAFGLDPARLLLVHAASENEVLWTVEEALRCASLAAVLGESRAASPMAVRRLQLAAEGSGVTALVLRPWGARVADVPAVSRWQVAAAPTALATLPPLLSRRWERAGPTQREGEGRDEGADVRSCWRLILARCRGAVPGSWLVTWCHETHRLALAAVPCDRPVAPPAPLSGRRRAG